MISFLLDAWLEGVGMIAKRIRLGPGLSVSDCHCCFILYHSARCDSLRLSHCMTNPIGLAAPFQPQPSAFDFLKLTASMASFKTSLKVPSRHLAASLALLRAFERRLSIRVDQAYTPSGGSLPVR